MAGKPNLRVIANDNPTKKRAARPQQKKKKPAPKGPPDPNVAKQGRTFEVIATYVTGEHIMEKRVRIRVTKGSLDDNVYNVHDIPCYFGMISEEVNAGKVKWSEYGWGHYPLSLEPFVREIFIEEKPDGATHSVAEKKS